MFFKNAYVINFSGSFGDLEALLRKEAFEPCGSHQPMSIGWASPTNDDQLIYNQGGDWLFKLQAEEKILPSSVINRKAGELAIEIEKQQGYKPGRKQMAEIKERIVQELLPTALTKIRSTLVWVDNSTNRIIIDTQSQSKAEEVIESLRYAFDDLKLSIPHTHVSPSSYMADILASMECESDFTIDQECALKSLDESASTVTYKKQSLEDVYEEIKSHLSCGKMPTKLAMTAFESASFVLSDTGIISKIFFAEKLIESAQESAENADEAVAADFVLMTGTLRKLINRLNECMGGEIEQQ